MMSAKVGKKIPAGQDRAFNPYPGLRPFKIEESHLFFGREGQTDEVLQKLSDHRFVGIIGPSGSGKSSFVYCGVLPILFGGFLTNTGPNWDVIVLRPGSSPIENLAQAILEKNPNYKADEAQDHDTRQMIISTLLRSNSNGLVEAVKQIKEATNMNYLILVDQFEELFRYKNSQENKYSVDDTLTFVQLLMDAVNHEDKDYYVAITMRSDFIGECATFAELTRKINDSHYLIPQLTREQKRAAVEGPAAVADGRVNPRLVQRLLNDLGDNPDQLPILQHSLMRTWDYWVTHKEKANESVDVKHYEAIGTMAEALSLHADEAYNQLNDKQKKIAEVMFKAITEKRGVFGIRRPTLLSQIAAIAGCSNKEVAEVVVVFRQPGRSFLTPPHGVKLGADSMIDISHESLMRIWVRLKNWVDEESEAVGMYMRLAEAAEMYQVGKAGLWRPPDLQLALNWQVKHKPTINWGHRYDAAFERTMSFLEYSKKEFDNEQRVRELQAKRRLRNARITAIVLGSAAVISIGFFVYATIQRGQAERERLEAELQRDKADSASTQARIQKDSALFYSQVAQDSAFAAQQQRRQAIIEKLRADTANLRAQESAQAARDSATEAQRARALALQREQEANEARDRAVFQSNRADSNATVATKARIIAVAKFLGVQAMQNIPDPQLRGLMSHQAFKFNDRVGGDKYDADIFGGLWASLGQQGFNDPSSSPLIGHAKEIYAVTTSMTNNATYTGGTRGRILKWISTEAGYQSSVVASAQGGSAQINDLDISDDGRWLVAAGEFSTTPNASSTVLKVFDLSNNRETLIPNIRPGVSSAKFLPDNSSIVYIDNGGKNLNKVKRDGASQTILYSSDSEIKRISVHPSGTFIAGATANGEIVIWNENGIVKFQFRSVDGESVESIQYSPDGRYLGYGQAFGSAILLDADNNNLIKKFTDHTGPVRDVNFNFANGRSTFMVTSSLDRSVRIWNLSSLNNPPIAYRENLLIFAAAFTPDNSHVFGGSERGNLKAYPAELQIMSGKMCSYIDRNMTPTEWDAYVGDDIPYEQTCPIATSSNSQ